MHTELSSPHFSVKTPQRATAFARETLRRAERPVAVQDAEHGSKRIEQYSSLHVCSSDYLESYETTIFVVQKQLRSTTLCGSTYWQEILQN